MTQRISWRFGALASAVALLGSLSSLEAHALALGRATVQSALGETLRAEVDIAEINAEEANSLRLSIGSAAAFKAAGLEYSATVVGMQVTLQKRPDGRSFLRLTTPRPVTEPFVDLVLEASWASGRVVRDYTLLFDPPNLRQAIGPTTAPGVNSSAAQQAAKPAASTQIAAPREVKPVPMARVPRPKADAPQKAPGNGQQVTVKAGDTASKIAGQNKAAGISLDQMLVALLQSNPNAFIGGNINRLKAGAVLDLPTEESASATSAGDATRTITAQSKDFNNFRRKLAEGAPTAQVAGADRQAGGKLQAKVDDNGSAAKTPDKLTLSKGAVQGKSAAEEKIAKDRQAAAESTRVAELSKNIGDLDKLRAKGTTATPAAPAAPASAAKAPGVSVPVPAAAPVVAAPTPPVVAATPVASAIKPTTPVPAVVAPAPAAPAAVASLPTPVPAPALPAVTASAQPAPLSAPTAATSTAVASLTTTATATATATASATVTVAIASAPVSPASATAPKPVPAKKVVAPPPEPTLVESLTDSPFALPALGGLLALLGGFGYYRYKKKDSLASVDSSFLESRLQPDSFFGASGGQRVDTSESSASGSSLVYSPSQLDAAGDVDPVAEADVYLAYGRDLQAEEILKEALRTTPTRVAIHSKLSEIYAKRRDIKGFESLATDAFALTNGVGPEWAYIAELGRDLDPANSLYKPGGQPLAAGAVVAAAGAEFGHDTMPVSRATNGAAADMSASVDDVDFDLDLDFSAGDTPVVAPVSAPLSRATAAAPAPVATAARTEPTVSLNLDPVPAFDSGSMDFDDIKVSTQPMTIKANAAAGPDSSYSKTQPLVAIKPSAAAAAPAAVLDSGMLEFDMNSLSLDLDSSSTLGPIAAKPVSAYVPEGPLETKFALAEEFRALGDPDGARSLANEVIAQAQGALKIKAQAFLNSLT